MQATKSVTKPTKQRKMIYQAPDHVRHKLFAAHLSAELRTSHKIKSLPVRSGDTVRIMRGDHEGFEGKIASVDRKNYRIYVEGLTREKVDGSTIFVPIHPSKVMVTRLNLDDKWRKKLLEKKKEAHKKVEEVAIEVEEKPPEEVAEIKEVVEEKPKAKKPRKRKKAVTKKPAKEKIEKKPEEAKPKAKKTRAKRRVSKKTEGGT